MPLCPFLKPQLCLEAADGGSLRELPGGRLAGS